VHVTQGTATTGTEQLIIPALRALADEAVLVVATTGGKAVESLDLDRPPSNARLERFVPHYHLMPHVDAMITNGGYGGVQTALAHGVPLVAAGGTEEKPEVCARVEWAGVGINLKTNRPNPAQIRQALRAVLNGPHYRRNIGRIQADIARHDAPVEAVMLLERLAETKQPVTVPLHEVQKENSTDTHTP
jgi:UDP:flavonoid glycosyltransferase YjiC (YdhE family)